MTLGNLPSQWAHQTVYLEHAASSWDGYGNPVLGSSSAWQAVVTYGTKSIIGRNGVFLQSNAQVLFSGNPTITIDDRLTMPDGTSSPIISIEQVPDFSGNLAYTRVYT
jgi:hypothetical protein